MQAPSRLPSTSEPLAKLCVAVEVGFEQTCGEEPLNRLSQGGSSDDVLELCGNVSLCRLPGRLLLRLTVLHDLAKPLLLHDTPPEVEVLRYLFLGCTCCRPQFLTLLVECAIDSCPIVTGDVLTEVEREGD